MFDRIPVQFNLAFKDNYFERRTLFAVDFRLAYRSVVWLEDKLIELTKLAKAITNKYTVHNTEKRILEKVAGKLNKA